MKRKKKMDRRVIQNHSKAGEVETRFFITSPLGSVLVLLIIILVCVIICMWILCVRGIHEKYCKKRGNMRHVRSGENWYLETLSYKDIESGNPMTYHPYFLSVRHSLITL